MSGICYADDTISDCSLYTVKGGVVSSINIWNDTSICNSNGNNILTNDKSEDYYKKINGLHTAYTQPDLIVTAINAYHYNRVNWALFNLSNEVDVTVENIGNATSGASNVSLYANNIFIGQTNVSALNPDSSETVKLAWIPTGSDCEDGGSSTSYTLKAIADCDSQVAESNENNNESSSFNETLYWAGYSADEHLTAIVYGTFQGGLYYTTGNGTYYSALYAGSSTSTVYNDIITSIPSGAEIELARLFIYYTWSRIGGMGSGNGIYPQMEVTITNTTGTYTVTRAANYSDRPCPPVYYDCPYGNYVYDITDYVEGGNSLTVTVKNVGPSNSNFCPAAPGIVILYEDNTKPEYDYYLVEGADLLEGGRRDGALYLGLNECLCNATIPGTINTGNVEKATLGIVSAWGGNTGSSYNSYYWFNDNLLGDMSMLGGYSWLYDETVNDISMYVGESNDAEIGANVSDVTGYIVGQNNKVTFGDDGDSSMPTNVFLLVETDNRMCGDVDRNGAVNIFDVRLLMNNVSHPGYPVDLWAGDVTGDGDVNSDDVLLLVRHVFDSDVHLLKCKCSEG